MTQRLRCPGTPDMPKWAAKEIDQGERMTLFCASREWLKSDPDVPKWKARVGRRRGWEGEVKTDNLCIYALAFACAVKAGWGLGSTGISFPFPLWSLPRFYRSDLCLCLYL